MIEKTGWCERGDSNPHPLRDQILSLARLPIPPLSRASTHFYSITYIISIVQRFFACASSVPKPSAKPAGKF